MTKKSNLLLNSNAGCFKRMFSFFIDSFIITLITTFFVKLFVFTKTRTIQINETIEEFKMLFGNIDVTNVKDYHIRFIVTSPIYDTFVLYIIFIILIAILYNFISYILFNRTLGQRIFSLKIVNINNDEKANIFKLFIKAILVQFPIKMIYLMIIGQFLYLTNFHKYAPIDNFFTSILVNITSISNIYTIALFLFIFLLFWYDIYFITDRLILSDIISRTRVVEAKKEIKSYIENENIEKSSFTSSMDFILDALYKLNKSLKNTLKKWINYLK